MGRIKTKRWLTEFRVIMPGGSDKEVCNWSGPDILAETLEQAEEIRKHWYPYCTIIGELVAEYDGSIMEDADDYPDYFEQIIGKTNEPNEITTQFGFEPCEN